MIRIAVLTDIHANLPALAAALDDIRARVVSAIYVTGDCIAIGPHPAECLALLLDDPLVTCIAGNHDRYFGDGLDWGGPMSDMERAHQTWTHAQIDPALKPIVARWPGAVRETFEGVRTLLTHYATTPDGRYVPAVHPPNAEAFDALFEAGHDLVFYGHDHDPADVWGRAHYVNPGALGTGPVSEARYLVATFERGRHHIARHAVPYDDASLQAAYCERGVPARARVCRVFHHGRFAFPD